MPHARHSKRWKMDDLVRAACHSHPLQLPAGASMSTHLKAGPLNVDHHVWCARPVVGQPLGDVSQLLHVACIGSCAASCLSNHSHGHSFTASCQPHMSVCARIKLIHVGYIPLWRMCSALQWEDEASSWNHQLWCCQQGAVKALAPVPMMTDAIVSVPSMYRTAASTPTVSFINAPTLAWMPCTNTSGSIPTIHPRRLPLAYPVRH